MKWLNRHMEGIVVTAIMIALGSYLVAHVVNKARMMQECMSDGRKEYECRAMIEPTVHVFNH